MTAAIRTTSPRAPAPCATRPLPVRSSAHGRCAGARRPCSSRRARRAGRRPRRPIAAGGRSSAPSSPCSSRSGWWRPTMCWPAPVASLPPPPRASRHTSTVVAQPGDTLWSIAERAPRRHLDQPLRRHAGRPQRRRLDRGRPADRPALSCPVDRLAVVGSLAGCIARAVTPTTPRSSTRASPRRARRCVAAGSACRARTGSPPSSASRRCRWSSSSPTGRRSRSTATRSSFGVRAATKGRSVDRGADRAVGARGRGRAAARRRRGHHPAGSGSPCSIACGVLDEVAYLRFASVYKNFDAASDFQSELELLSKLSAQPAA